MQYQSYILRIYPGPTPSQSLSLLTTLTTVNWGATFQRVLWALLPRLRQRWAERQRPLPAAVVRARQHFREVLIADGSTLEALFRKLKALQELPKGRLAGKICTVMDLASRLPRYVWFTELAQAHDINFI